MNLLCFSLRFHSVFKEKTGTKTEQKTEQNRNINLDVKKDVWITTFLKKKKKRISKAMLW
jgi:hypothetical protein